MEDNHLDAEQYPRNRYSLIVDSSSTIHDGEHINAQKDESPLARPIKINMLDPMYSYNPYLDHDEENEAHYRYK